MTIANRILAGFAAVTALLIAIGAVGIYQIGQVRDRTQTIVSNDLALSRQVNMVRLDQQRMRYLAELTVTDFFAGPASRADVPQRIEAWTSQAALTKRELADAIALAKDIQLRAVSTERAQAWRQIADSLTASEAQLDALIARRRAQMDAMRRGDAASALAVRAGFEQGLNQFDQVMNDVLAILEQNTRTGQAEIAATYNRSVALTLGGVVASAVLAGIVAFLIRRSIVGPLDAFMAFVERVGRGDLTGQTANIGPDEIGRLGVTLNSMVEGLKQLAAQSREATENLNAATAEIRASTQEQAASVEEQLAAVQETAATVDEITHSGAQIGKRAQEVIATAQATAQSGAEGLRAVDETARAMDAIREQAETVAENIVALSEKTQTIGEIIATVNDISERSHLLALNAALEAASAGENGRAFAVVASEMKVLADQAKAATGQVRSILGDIQRGINSSVMLTEEAVKRVAAGKERTDTTQRTITEISGRVQESVQTFQQIIASTNQQQLGIEQVMGALQNIRQASQQTAAGTRQLDEAAANLSGLSRQLLTLAERYRV